jgi:Mg-chelatase subunit ChlD
VSPEVGVLDEDAFADAMDNDPDAALSLLAELTGATDEKLRALARSLAGRIITDLVRAGHPRKRGVGKLARRRGGDGDVDIDASLPEVADARAAGRAPSLDDLTVTAWQNPEVAVCLLVDRSGSMLGERLAAAGVAAAAVAYRHGADCSLVAFSDQAIVLQSQGVPRSPEDVAGDLFRLRGHGTTDIGLALRTARDQLDRSTAGRKVALLLSDCRSTTGGDPTGDAAAIQELAIVAPADDTADAEWLAEAVGARLAPLHGPSSVPEAVAIALAR